MQQSARSERRDAPPEAPRLDAEREPSITAALQERLERALAGAARKRVFVGYACGDRREYAGVGGEDLREEAVKWIWPMGCITKLFTAALVGRAVHEAGLSVQDYALDALGLGARRHAVARGVTIKHLLEHTHGLDDGGVCRLPLAADGFIDAAELLDRLEGTRFAPSGSIYSYSSAGAWLLAAVLECVHGERFEQTLRGKLCTPLQMRIRGWAPSLLPDRPDRVCPSMGATLAFSAEHLLTFLLAAAPSGAGRWSFGDDSGGAAITPLPGWNALELGVYRGWKYHGEGWFGHNSTWPGASLMVRVQPRRRIALTVASEDHPAPVIAAKLFAAALPEFRTLSFPKPLPAQQARSKLANRGPCYCGRYRSANRSLEVEAGGPDALRLRGRGIDSALIPAADDTFFLRPPGPGLHYLQFLGETQRGFRYVWDGRRVLYR